MTHADVLQNLNDYLEGDLSLESRASFDAHIDQCADCAREVDEMQSMVQLLRTLPDPEVPPMISANVMRRIRAGEAEPNWMERIARALGNILEPTFVLPASAVAVAALVAMVIQDPGFLSRFSVDVDGADAPRANRAAAASPGFDVSRAGAEMAGLNLELPRPLGADSNAKPRPGSSATGGVIAPQGGLTYRFEFDASTSRGAIRLAPSAAASRGSSFASRPASSPRRTQGLVVNEGLRSSRQARVVSDDRGGVGSNSGGWARRAAQTAPGTNVGMSAESSGGEDPRDEWLARGLERPGDFARFLAEKSLAEQELWVSRLGARAQERGMLDDLIRVLRSSGDAAAAILSDDFAAQIQASVESDQSWGANGTR